MLKFSKAVFAVLGVVAAAFLIFFMVKMFVRYDDLWRLVNHDHLSSARPYMWLVPATALLTGLFLGISIGLPSRTARSIRREVQDSYAREQAPLATARPHVSDERVVDPTTERR